MFLLSGFSGPLHPPPAAQVGNSSWEPRHAQPSCLAAVLSTVFNRCYFCSAWWNRLIVLVPKARGLCITQENMAIWCSNHDIQPHCPLRFDLAYFWANLSSGWGLSTSPVRVHQVAVCTSIHQLEGSPGRGHLIWMISSEGFAEVRGPCRVLSWDLFPVLSALQLSWFESVGGSYLKHLTLKTAFLSLWLEAGGVVRFMLSAGFLSRLPWAQQRSLATSLGWLLSEEADPRVPIQCHLCEVPYVCLGPSWWGSHSFPCAGFACLQEKYKFFPCGSPLPASVLGRELLERHQEVSSLLAAKRAGKSLLAGGPGLIWLSSCQAYMNKPLPWLLHFLETSWSPQ